MSTINPPGRVLVNLSGGIDSAYCLYEALSAGRDVLVHHIRLKNHEGRRPYEYAAVLAIRLWLRQHGLTRYTYVESSFDYGTLRYVVRDAKLWSFLSAVILLNPKHADVNEVIIPSHLDSPIMQNKALQDEISGIIRATIAGAREVPLISYPIGKKLKKEVVASMPKDLLAKCWWCRKPVGGKPCKVCHSCKRYAKAIAE